MTMIALNPTNDLNRAEGNGLFSRIAEAVRGWQLRSQTRAELNRLSDRELEDIGILRADIEALVAGRA